MIKKNAKENSQRTNHQHTVRDLVLIVKKKHEKNSKLETPIEGPYEIIQVHNSGNVVIWRGGYEQRISIRHIKPHHNASEQES